ncbi:MULTISPECIES: bestrophin family protein [Chryseobacterium]|uniref:Membrane protein n=1 Tax=Chryseobacterium camelliae TaxID=1265445 RepID=A0ABU0TM67_9FLAO|nr:MULTISPECIES: bestrophin family ion channel [Chryseobacterium]MDT3408003.1 putative membrane protein [Pseudacidovorax intermedius]MDQ1098140.1 putative membrane protein [Chryseobacterium camelliae]MDQ1102070.1 putative membrane protein [Chryseobacterium sp. SORGH_AS_1048]MDR6085507.1 putative membrane protein [Chryseobacterium sp. SORGH_AS_0909]MDR6129870.1 putative membrane protein [Chryseobacterium sp. SORGH_AS_1175]
MRAYNTKNFLKILFSLHKSDTLKILFPTMILVGLYSYGIAYLELEYLHLNSKSKVSNVGLIHSLLGFVLSLLLVFRTNTAYDRWWEGRKLWGKLVNDTRNFAIKVTILLEGNTKDIHQIARYLKFFPHFLAKHLSKESTRLALDEDYSEIEKSLKQHGPSEIITLLSHKLHQLKKDGKISDVEMIYLDTQLSGFLDVCGACERIKNTPIPYSYSSFVKKFIILYVLALPVAYVINIGMFMIPLTVFVYYVLMSLELIAEEIEDPFNNDENDIPMETIAQNIEKNVHQIMDTK